MLRKVRRGYRDREKIRERKKEKNRNNETKGLLENRLYLSLIRGVHRGSLFS
jgi:hypothetical protein